MQWFVLDMDKGVLRKEDTRKAALKWFMRHEGAAKVIKRHSYGPGAYEYHVGHSSDDYSGAFIEREDAARGGGWKVDQAALYPCKDEPFKFVAREDS